MPVSNGVLINYYLLTAAFHGAREGGLASESSKKADHGATVGSEVRALGDRVYEYRLELDRVLNPHVRGRENVAHPLNSHLT